MSAPYENRHFLAEDPVCIENSDSQVGIHGTTYSSPDRCRTALPGALASDMHFANAPAILSGASKAERKAAPNHITNVSYPGLCSIEQHI